MELIKNLLVAIDFTQSSENLLRNAILFAKSIGSQITIIHVLPDDISNEKFFPLIESGAREELKKVNDSIVKEGISTGNPILAFGNYADRIVTESERLDVNMVVVGAGEKAKKDSFQLGSTAEIVVRLSKKPVFVVKNNHTLTSKNIICPVDFSKESSLALRNALVIARLFKAKIVVLTVCPIFKSSGYSLRRNEEFFNDYRLKDQEKEFNNFIKNFDFSDIDYESKVVAGEPAEEILNAIKNFESDLLVMGTTGKSGIARILIGSVTEKVIRRVLCSFITLKNESAIA